MQNVYTDSASHLAGNHRAFAVTVVAKLPCVWALWMGLFGWCFARPILAQAQNHSAAPRTQRAGSEDRVVIEFDLDVEGRSIGARHRGTICAGTIGGKLGIVFPDGSRAQFDVQGQTAHIRCMNCLPSRESRAACPCEQEFFERVELLRYSFGQEGDYTLLGQDLTLSCAPGAAHFQDAHVFAREHELHCKESMNSQIWEALHTPLPKPVPPPAAQNTVLAQGSTSNPVSQNRLEVVLIDYETARRLPNVPVVLQEVQSCPPNRRGGCTPAKPHVLTARTSDGGVAQFVLPSRRTDAATEPLGLHYFVKPFSLAPFVGTYPLEHPVPVPGRRRPLFLAEQGDATRPHRLIYVLVPKTALRAKTVSEARALAEKAPPKELESFLLETHAQIRSVKAEGLLWKIQWVGDGRNPHNNQRCYYLDSIQGTLFSTGMQSCNP
ncbi:MAG TPA: hypothetical protein PKE31_16365 [Pseudomonadota bacterium]|nr:hypothetical protein [Pseudomonadota bacterium]